MVDGTPHAHFRTLGTPDESMWPGVTTMPDYKSSFPKWPAQSIGSVVKVNNPEAIDLLQVRIHFNI